MGVLQNAYDSVIAACNDAYIGYSQDFNKRRSIKLGLTTVTYCDCSSLMSWALTRGGYFKSNPWFGTGNERAKLAAAGWTQVNINGPWLAGDIVWRAGHTEMVHTGGNGQGRCMGAHQAGIPLADQVKIDGYISSANNYSELWRDTGATPVGDLSWIQDEHNYLPIADRDNNAYLVFTYLEGEGFSSAAIAGILGNMYKESGINPAQWQNFDIGNLNLGYGLVQWTPASNYINWASSHNIDRTDPDDNGKGEMDYLVSTWSGHWIPTSSYPYSLSQYKQLTDWEEACKAFYYEYERGAIPDWPTRLDAAERYYNMIENGSFPGGGGDPGSGTDYKMQLGGIINELHRRLVLPGYI